MEKKSIARELSADTKLCHGKYIIDGVIGVGGFGITYKATQKGLNRVVAIKEYFLSGYCVRHTQEKTVLPQDLKEKTYEHYRQKFVEEAIFLSKLKHPNIVDVIDFFDENNTSYMVMTFIEGETLQNLVEKRGTLDYVLMINYLSQIADAVGYIHSKKHLHRDIKPENIIITPDFHAILIDFGSAREFEQDKPQEHTAMLTQGYAPLEQYDKKAKRGSYTDIYALGAVYYFALTGQKPMDATTRTMENMPEPKTLNPAIAKNVNRTIMKAMAMKPEKRHQTIEDFFDDLLGKRPSESTSKSEMDAIEKPKNKLIIVLIVIIGLMGIGGFAWRCMEREKEFNKSRIKATENFNNLHFNRALEYVKEALEIKPDNEEMKNLKTKIESKIEEREKKRIQEDEEKFQKLAKEIEVALKFEYYEDALALCDSALKIKSNNQQMIDARNIIINKSKSYKK